MEHTIKEFNTVKDLVVKLMSNEERCRNDDKYLTFRVMQHYTKIYIPYDDFKKIPAFETIKRCRAIVQNNEGRLLPTLESVRNKRKQRQNSVRRWTARK